MPLIDIQLRKGWNLQEAIDFVRTLQSVAWNCNLHLALAGSVLNHGSSEKDLDIICMDQNKPEQKGDWTKFEQFLKSLGSFRQKTGAQYETENRLIYGLILRNSQEVDIFRYDI